MLTISTDPAYVSLLVEELDKANATIVTLTLERNALLSQVTSLLFREYGRGNSPTANQLLDRITTEFLADQLIREAELSKNPYHHDLAAEAAKRLRKGAGD